MGLIVLVSGGREYIAWDTVNSVLTEIHKETPIDKIVHGGARGADTLGGKWARENNVLEKIYKPDWNTYGKAAGMVRNQEMLDKESIDLLASFPGGKGTADMKKRAKYKGVEIKEVQE